jgi:hypothetical protein
MPLRKDGRQLSLHFNGGQFHALDAIAEDCDVPTGYLVKMVIFAWLATTEDYKAGLAEAIKGAEKYAIHRRSGGFAKRK